MTARSPAPGRPAHADPDPDAAAWDAVVEANSLGSYLQLSAWARVKAVNGWTSRRLHDPAVGAGAQVLLRRAGPPFSIFRIRTWSHPSWFRRPEWNTRR